ncbi:hypothetical protein TRVL_10255 [Trypanosoma vivax]|nr:hypothetical protein TRVL_10255 [Trypanosoma vivax]
MFEEAARDKTLIMSLSSREKERCVFICSYSHCDEKCGMLVFHHFAYAGPMPSKEDLKMHKVSCINSSRCAAQIIIIISKWCKIHFVSIKLVIRERAIADPSFEAWRVHTF